MMRTRKREAEEIALAMRGSNGCDRLPDDQELLLATAHLRRSETVTVFVGDLRRALRASQQHVEALRRRIADLELSHQRDEVVVATTPLAPPTLREAGRLLLLAAAFRLRFPRCRADR